MIDCNSNSAAWAARKSDILVFGIGALEQHGLHLPLNVDIMNADYAAQLIARHFDAPLLPTLPFGTSLEHKGFAGSFSLKPGTLSKIVKDIACEARDQRFKILIIASGHGGNQVLVPACRMINHRNIGLRILPVFPAEFADTSTLECFRRKVMDIHAGENETSRFLALGGRLTAPLPAETAAEADAVNWRQQDLTAFSIGRLNHSGVLGIPAFATAEKGRELLDSIARNMLACLDQRIGQIRAAPEY